jgi:hypothetical protein
MPSLFLISALFLASPTYGQEPAESAKPEFSEKALRFIDRIDDVFAAFRIGSPQLKILLEGTPSGTWIPNLAAFVRVNTRLESWTELDPITLELERVDSYSVRFYARPNLELWVPFLPYLSGGARAGVIFSRTYRWTEVRKISEPQTFKHPFEIVRAIRDLGSSPGVRDQRLQVSMENHFELMGGASIQAGAKVAPVLGAVVLEEGEVHRFQMSGRSLTFGGGRTQYRAEGSRGFAASQGLGVDFVGLGVPVRKWFQLSTGTRGSFDQASVEIAEDKTLQCPMESLYRGTIDCGLVLGQGGEWKERRSFFLFGLVKTQSTRERRATGEVTLEKDRTNRIKKRKFSLTLQQNSDQTTHLQAVIDLKNIPERWRELDPRSWGRREKETEIVNAKSPLRFGASLLVEATLETSDVANLSRMRTPSWKRLEAVIDRILLSDSPVRLSYLDLDSSSFPVARVVQFFREEERLTREDLGLLHYGSAQFFFPQMNSEYYRKPTE